MRLSQGVEWAVHACTLLAATGSERSLSLAALAEFHGVPQAYMAKQMQLLSRAGLVRTSRGKTGGYALARQTDQITLWDITRALNGNAPIFHCTEIRQRGPCATKPADCRTACPIAQAFAGAERVWRDALARTTIADICGQVASGTSSEHMIDAAVWLGRNITDLPRTDA